MFRVGNRVKSGRGRGAEGQRGRGAEEQRLGLKSRTRRGISPTAWISNNNNVCLILLPLSGTRLHRGGHVRIRTLQAGCRGMWLESPTNECDSMKRGRRGRITSRKRSDHDREVIERCCCCAPRRRCRVAGRGLLVLTADPVILFHRLGGLMSSAPKGTLI